MDDMKISLSVPATIYSFGETQSLTQNKYVTHAKLKVFYIGKTGDNRVFTKQFSDQLLQTLPGTPVVAYYDEDKDDFVGHNPVQYVFGYVPEAATIQYVEENGSTFAVTDVLLFTGRPDLIGQVASKIIGKSHSLELDPGTVEYTIVRANRMIESITFTKGHFIGLSVLGNNEQPAFAGSSFFTEGDEIKTFVDSFKEFKQEVELYKSGGQLMNEENNLPTLTSEQDIVASPEVVVEEVPAVEITEPVIEVQMEETPTEPMVEEVVEAAPMVDEPEDEEDEKEEDKEDPEKDEEPTFVEQVEQVEVSSEIVVEAQILEQGMEDVREQTNKEEVQGSQAAYTSALNDAERQELNEYRKKAKFELIEMYSELDDEIKEDFRNRHADFTVDQLDKELAYVLVKSQRQNKKGGVKVFALMQETPKEKTLADIVAQYKDKK